MNHKKICALLLAGSFLCCGCAGGRVKKGVIIGGEEVGGMGYAEAAEKIRASLEKDRLPLVVHAPSGDVSASLDYSDNVGVLVRTAKKGERLTPSVTRVWVNAEEELARICAQNARESRDASLSFSAAGFAYSDGVNGVACDYAKLLRDATEALKGEGREVTLECREYPPALTRKMLEAQTLPLAEFSTAFDAANEGRAGNIALAASRLTGRTIGAGETLSFNAAVGERTEANGFQVAPVILDGEFVQGVGGGVCQASTTLFGAALRAGLEIAESHPHSLNVGYVPPSEDAMVSSSSDLVLRNPYPTPVYLLGSAGSGRVTFSFFGPANGTRYEVESVVIKRLDPPAAEIVEGTENRTVRAPRQGLVSESYLVAYDKEGRLLFRTLIRRDRYASVRGIFERVPLPKTPEEILAGEE